MTNAVLFCTPTYGGMVTTAHFDSCMNLRRVLDQVGLANDWVTGTRESLITRARNEMTATFLSATEYSHQCWLDSDIEFTPEDFSAIWNLSEGPYQADIAVGVYAMKVPDKQWFACWKNGRLVTNLDQFSGPIEVDFAGTGFMLIKKSVIEKVHQNLKDFEEKANNLVNRLLVGMNSEDANILRSMINDVGSSYESMAGSQVPALYMTPIHKNCFESEDYHFCRLAREAGFKVWMDPSVRLGHVGQYTYGDSGISGNLRGVVSPEVALTAV